MNPLDHLNLALTGPLASGHAPKTDAAKEQFAKDFESVLLERLLDEMKDTIGDWGVEQDGASKQVQGLFWMNLAREMADRGGIGLSKEIYQSLQTETPGSETVDNQL